MDMSIKILTAVSNYLREQGLAAALYTTYAGEPLAVGIPCIVIGIYPEQCCIRFDLPTNLFTVYITYWDNAECWFDPKVLGKLELADPMLFDQLETWARTVIHV